jgi:predicted alpha/beta-hydrolase family hydrolase
MSNPYEISSLEIHGYQHHRVENKFFRQEQLTATLAVVLPGWGYTCDMPLLYYTTRLFLEHGTDVLQLRADYATPDFQAASREQRAGMLYSDAQALFASGRSQRDYMRVIVVGKSLGTITMASLVIQNQLPPMTLTVWLTPLLDTPRIVEALGRLAGPSLVIGGSVDQAYNPEILAQIQELPGITALTIEGANHSLEIPGDLPRSIRLMDEILQSITGFIDPFIEK